MVNNSTKPNKFGGNNRTFTIVTIVSASLAIAAFCYFFPTVETPKVPPTQIDAFAQIRVDSEKETEIGIEELSDFAPIFLPTKWNYKFAKNIDGGEIREEIPAGKLSYAVEIQSPDFVLGDVNTDTKKPAILRSIMYNVFSGFGRNKTKAYPPQKKAAVKIVDMNNGKTLKAELIPNETSAIMISPAEFIIDVSEDGWVSRPLTMKSSGTESNDTEILKYIAKGSLLRALPSGHYKIVFTF